MIDLEPLSDVDEQTLVAGVDSCAEVDILLPVPLPLAAADAPLGLLLLLLRDLMS